MSNPSDSQNTKVGFEQGGDVLFVKSGGKLRVDPGGIVDIPEGALAAVTFDGDYFEVNGGVVTLKADIVALLDLVAGIPDADPAVDFQVWNDSGTLVVSNGN